MENRQDPSTLPLRPLGMHLSGFKTGWLDGQQFLRLSILPVPGTEGIYGVFFFGDAFIEVLPPGCE